MDKLKFVSIFFQFFYYRGLHTGDGFKIRISFGNVGLIFRIYWGPYKDSRHILCFIGIDRSVLLERKVYIMMKKLTPEKRLAILKSLLELDNIGK